MISRRKEKHVREQERAELRQGSSEGGSVLEGHSIVQKSLILSCLLHLIVRWFPPVLVHEKTARYFFFSVFVLLNYI